MTRMSGWQRIGLVLSAVWLPIGAYLGNELGLAQGDWAVDILRHCMDAPNADSDACHVIFNQDYADAVQYHWWAALIVALVPIPLAWLTVYGAIKLVTWIGDGFRQPS